MAIDLDLKKVVWEFLAEGAKTVSFKVYNTERVLEEEMFRAELREMKVDNYQKIYNFYKKVFSQEGQFSLLL